MLITGNQLRAARALAGVDQAWVAKEAKVAINTIRNMESRGPDAITSGAVTVRNVQLAMERAGIEFTNGHRPGVRMKPWQTGDQARLRRASERHSASFEIEVGQVTTVLGWRMNPGDPPWGRLQLRLASGNVTPWIEASHFERVI